MRVDIVIDWDLNVEPIREKLLVIPELWPEPHADYPDEFNTVGAVIRGEVADKLAPFTFLPGWELGGRAIEPNVAAQGL